MNQCSNPACNRYVSEMWYCKPCDVWVCGECIMAHDEDDES